MALFYVTVEFGFVMESATSGKAWSMAISVAAKAASDGGADERIASVRSIDAADEIPPGWRSAIPYGGDGKRSVLQIITSAPPRAGKEDQDAL